MSINNILKEVGKAHTEQLKELFINPLFYTESRILLAGTIISSVCLIKGATYFNLDTKLKSAFSKKNMTDTALKIAGAVLVSIIALYASSSCFGEEKVIQFLSTLTTAALYSPGAYVGMVFATIYEIASSIFDS